MDDPNIPTRKESMQLLANQNLPKNLMEHIFIVNKIAVFLAEQLRNSGTASINTDLVDKASLLHDIAKPVDFGRNTNLHPRVGADMLAKKGYLEIAEIIKKHTITSVLAPLQKDKLSTWEEKIVFYADKRENEGKIVSVKERLLGWREMQKPMEFEKYYSAVSALEREIFGQLNFRPDQLTEKMLKSEID